MSEEEANHSSKTHDLSNLDNYCSGGAAVGEEKLAGKNPMGSISNSLTVSTNETSKGGLQRKRSRARVRESGKTACGDLENKGNGVGDSNHVLHIWTERERRKKMRNMFDNLHELLPQLAPKADKSTIVDETVKYIKALRNTVKDLEKQKEEIFQGRASSLSYDQSSIFVPQQNQASDDSRETFLAGQGYSNKVFNMPSNSRNSVNSLNSLSVSSAHHSYAVFQTWTSPHVNLSICGDQAYINICSPKKLGLFTAICYVFDKYNITVVSAQISSDSNRIMSMIHAHANRGASDQLFEEFPVAEIFKQVVGEIISFVSL
ncbi:hypothetical protein UlMin_046066 [Ulmus minor]